MLTAFDLRNAFLPTIPAGYVYTSSLAYSRVKRDYLRGAFWDYYRARLAAIAIPGVDTSASADLRTWLPDWPCWCFTQFYLIHLAAANAVTLGKLGSSFPAAGRWDFHPDASRGMPPNENHSIVTVFTEYGIDRIDPQNNQLWIPLQSELILTRKLDF
jgi:hypothetical protein